MPNTPPAPPEHAVGIWIVVHQSSARTSTRSATIAHAAGEQIKSEHDGRDGDVGYIRHAEPWTRSMVGEVVDLIEHAIGGWDTTLRLIAILMVLGALAATVASVAVILGVPSIGAFLPK